MHRLIGDGVVVEVLHDVDFSAIRPLDVGVGQHPYCGPRPLCASQLGANLHLAIFYCALVACVEAACDEACGVGLEVRVYASAQYQFPITHGIQRVGV